MTGRAGRLLGLGGDGVDLGGATSFGTLNTKVAGGSTDATFEAATTFRNLGNLPKFLLRDPHPLRDVLAAIQHRQFRAV